MSPRKKIFFKISICMVILVLGFFIMVAIDAKYPMNPNSGGVAGIIIFVLAIAATQFIR